MLDDQWEQLDQDEAPPVDMLAAFFEARGWLVDRVGEDELSVEIKGNWTSYQMRAVWRNEDHVLQILLLPEIRVPDEKKPVIYETLGLINEQLWLGHFDLWSNNNILLFRHATLLGGSGMLGLDQAQTIVDLAIMGAFLSGLSVRPVERQEPSGRDRARDGRYSGRSLRRSLRTGLRSAVIAAQVEHHLAVAGRDQSLQNMPEAGY